MTNDNKQIIDTAIEGIKDVKGKRIVLVDMTGLDSYSIPYFLICQGESNTQVNAIAESVKDRVRNDLRVKPFAVDGLSNAEWVAMDYGDVMVHVFQPETRDFYQLETLWEDAQIKEFADED